MFYCFSQDNLHVDFLNGKKKKRIKFKDLMNISVVIGQCVIILTGIFASDFLTCHKT